MAGGATESNTPAARPISYLPSPPGSLTNPAVMVCRAGSRRLMNKFQRLRPSPPPRKRPAIPLSTSCRARPSAPQPSAWMPPSSIPRLSRAIARSPSSWPRPSPPAAARNRSASRTPRSCPTAARPSPPPIGNVHSSSSAISTPTAFSCRSTPTTCARPTPFTRAPMATISARWSIPTAPAATSSSPAAAASGASNAPSRNSSPRSAPPGQASRCRSSCKWRSPPPCWPSWRAGLTRPSTTQPRCKPPADEG